MNVTIQCRRGCFLQPRGYPLWSDRAHVSCWCLISRETCCQQNLVEQIWSHFQRCNDLYVLHEDVCLNRPLDLVEVIWSNLPSLHWIEAARAISVQLKWNLSQRRQVPWWCEICVIHVQSRVPCKLYSDWMASISWLVDATSYGEQKCSKEVLVNMWIFSCIVLLLYRCSKYISQFPCPYHWTVPQPHFQNFI